jgi:hypothetical protein
LRGASAADTQVFACLYVFVPQPKKPFFCLDAICLAIAAKLELLQHRG